MPSDAKRVFAVLKCDANGVFVVLTCDSMLC